MDWIGVKNGELLRRMRGAHFDALITIDKNLRYQQNPKTQNLKVFVLNAVNNKLSRLAPYVARLEVVINKQDDGIVVVVDL